MQLKIANSFLKSGVCSLVIKKGENKIISEAHTKYFDSLCLGDWAMPCHQIREIQQIDIEQASCNPLYPTVLLHYNCNIISGYPIGSTFLNKK